MFGRSSGKLDLPSVPATLARVIQITNSPDATAEQVASVVMLDQSLATKVLRLANSAFFGRRTKTETISEAVVTLGFSSIRNLAASASVVDALFPRQMFVGFCWQDMWVHSVTCGLAAEAIYRRMVGRACGASESAFIAGLLHDVGKLILARALPQRFIQVVDACREYNYDMIRAETNILGTNQAKVGGELAQQWEFPSKLQAGIAYHHVPDAASDHEDIAKAVQAGNLLAKRMGRNYLVGVPVDISLKSVADASDIALGDMDMIVNQVREGLRHCGEILSWADMMP
jgi:HD-like signal output (HDOD) protein